EFQLPQSTNVKLTVFNILGEKVTEILNEELEAGFYSFYFDGKYHSSGVYIYQLKTSGFTQARKMILTK
ncbi:MAG: T9SS type A sorting domain-containing protein, partial [Ignavibacteriaceae bacterium]|nr:T9SS type A sorting domain-containing protein [Ignavibacteriaceae bacterium]